MGSWVIHHAKPETLDCFFDVDMRHIYGPAYEDSIQSSFSRSNSTTVLLPMIGSKSFFDTGATLPSENPNATLRLSLGPGALSGWPRQRNLPSLCTCAQIVVEEDNGDHDELDDLDEGQDHWYPRKRFNPELDFVDEFDNNEEGLSEFDVSKRSAAKEDETDNRASILTEDVKFVGGKPTDSEATDNMLTSREEMGATEDFVPDA